MLEKLNKQTPASLFAGRLDLEIGITGRSYGGSAASQVCLDDRRFVCEINIDAPTYCSYGDRDLRKPFMLLGSELMKLLGKRDKMLLRRILQPIFWCMCDFPIRKTRTFTCRFSFCLLRIITAR